MANRGQLMIDLFPENLWGYTRLGDGLRELGRIDEAKKVYLTMLKKFPGEFRPYGRLQHLAWICEEYEESLKWSKRMIEWSPQTSFGYIRAYNSLLMLGNQSELESFAAETQRQWPKLSFSGSIGYATLLKSGISIGHSIHRFPTLDNDLWNYLFTSFRFFGSHDLKNSLELQVDVNKEDITHIFMQTLRHVLAASANDSLGEETNRLIINTIEILAQDRVHPHFLGFLSLFLSDNQTTPILRIFDMLKEYYIVPLGQIEETDLPVWLEPQKDKKKLYAELIHHLGSAFWDLEPYSRHTYDISISARLARQMEKENTNHTSADVAKLLEPSAFRFMDRILDPGNNDELNHILNSKKSNEILTVVFISNAYKELFPTWLANFSKYTDNLVIVALDKRVQNYLKKRYPELDILLVNIHHDNRYAFNLFLWKTRLNMARYLLEQGFDILISGVDIFLVNDPRPLLKRINADMISVQNGFGHCNVGGDLLILKSTHAMKNILKKVIKFYPLSFTDEGAFNTFFSFNIASIHRRDRHNPEFNTYSLTDERFTICLLKEPLFVSDYLYLKNQQTPKNTFFYLCQGLKPFKMKTLQTQALALWS